MPPRSLVAWQREELPIYDVTGRRPRLVVPPSASSIETEPSPLLEAIRAYLERAR